MTERGQLSNLSEAPAPIVGGIYKAKRSRTGREWECTRTRWGAQYHLIPLGGDWGSGGGVKSIWRTAEQIEANFILERLR